MESSKPSTYVPQSRFFDPGLNSSVGSILSVSLHSLERVATSRGPHGSPALPSHHSLPLRSIATLLLITLVHTSHATRNRPKRVSACKMQITSLVAR